MAIKDLVSPEHTPYLVFTTGIPEEPQFSSQIYHDFFCSYDNRANFATPELEFVVQTLSL